MPITIRSSFTVDAPPEQAWRSLVDIESSAPCFPGAQLKEKQPDGSYKGAFAVKLGPLTFNFAGKFKIAEQNDAERAAVVAASGTDTKGRGGAEANIHVKVLDAGGKSQVDVVSEVNLSGTVAQYGRGVSMIEALSQQLLNQFAKNLTAQIEADAAPEVPQVPQQVSQQAPQQAPVSEAATNAPGTAPQVSAPAPAPSAPSAPAQTAAPAAAATPAAAPQSAPPTPSTPPARRAPPVAAAPLDAGSLMRKALWQSIRNFFARLFGAKQKP